MDITALNGSTAQPQTTSAKNAAETQDRFLKLLVAQMNNQDPLNPMIGQGNAVPSTSVANVRIEQRGRGATADAHAVGWLSRFFLNIAPS